MSEKTTSKPVTPSGDKLVDFTAPLLPGQERQDLIVGVNGEIIRIRRGQSVKIKAKFVRVLEAAARQQVEAHEADRRAQRTEKLCDI